MIRAYLYLGAAGIIWLIEGFLFSYYLRFDPWQVAMMATVYVTLYAIAVWYFLRSLREPHERERDLSVWRMVSIAPMVVMVVGSFVSLPLILLVAALGKLA